jgi:hypothetical protein
MFSVESVQKNYKMAQLEAGEQLLHKDYYRKGSVEKKRSLVVSLKGLDAKTN